MKAFITGVLGQDGSHLSELLLSKDYEVYGMMRRISVERFDNIQHLMHHPKFRLVVGDLADQNCLNRLIKDIQPDEVYNLAAMSHVGHSFDQPIFTGDVTGLGVTRVLEAVKLFKSDAKFYQASSSEMYGKVHEIPQTEKTPFHPRSPYGVAKVYGYWITVNYRESYNMFCCNGILYNHESVPKHSPIIIKKDGLIDILPIEDVFKRFSHRYEGVRDSYEGSLVWDGKEWTEILGGHCYRDQEKPILCIQTMMGPYEATHDHVAFREDGNEVKTSEWRVGEKVSVAQYPELQNTLTHDTALAKAIGYIAGDGYVSEQGDLRITGTNKEELISIADIIVSRFGWLYRLSTWGPGGFENSKIDVWHIDFSDSHDGGNSSRGMRDWARWLTKQLYTEISREKRVPRFIINASREIRKAFFDGYYMADGRKKGSERYHYKGWTTNSATLCLGLLFISRDFLKQDAKIELQYRDGSRYYYCDLRTPNETNKGKHRLKPLNQIVKIFDTKSDGWFFDLTTTSQRFAVGPNLIQVHNSPRRGLEFVTRKITDGVARIKLGKLDKLGLGTLSTKRDWGHAKDYVEAMHLMLQQDQPDDYVVATGETHTIEEFAKLAFESVGLDYQKYIYIDPRFARPAEVDILIGDASKAKAKLGWEPKVKFPQLVEMMVQNDLKRHKGER